MKVKHLTLKWEEEDLKRFNRGQFALFLTLLLSLSLFLTCLPSYTPLSLYIYLSLSRSPTNGQNVSISIEVVVIITFDTNSAAAANEWPTSGRTLSSKIHSKRLEKSLSRFLKRKNFLQSCYEFSFELFLSSKTWPS